MFAVGVFFFSLQRHDSINSYKKFRKRLLHFSARYPRLKRYLFEPPFTVFSS